MEVPLLAIVLRSRHYRRELRVLLEQSRANDRDRREAFGTALEVLATQTRFAVPCTFSASH